MRKKKWFFLAPLIVVGIAAFVWIGGELVMHLWNWLAPALFGWRQITFWQAVGLLALCRILFGGHGFRTGRSRMRGRMRDRMDKMTPEEREKFRQAMLARCGFGAPSSGTPSGGGEPPA